MPSIAAIATLLVALLLPWLLGAALLASIAPGVAPGARARLLGYGFFLGYSLLFALLVAFDAAQGHLSFPAILSALAVITAAAVTLAAWRRRGGAIASVAEGRGASANAKVTGSTEPLARFLLFFFAVLCALHLVLGFLEVLHRPVFPWDAWLSWMYRAKAWFHAGALLPMDNPGDWALGEADQRYNVEGNHYPRFVPVVALWAALALGQWSETLVNLPYVGLALALGLALYGQARALALPRWGAALCCYLMLSLPLLGAHLSLAGQADVWMAGFTGLGFVALLRGLTRRDRGSMLFGLAMVAFGLCVKAEGVVWLLLAVGLSALALWPGRVLAMLGVAGLALVLAWLAGFQSVELPLLGRVGYLDGRLYLPLLGEYAYVSHDLSVVIAEHFVASGSWHLLWTLLLLACVAGLWHERGRRALVPLAFLLLTIAAITAIFAFSEQGQWAKDGTAINRLPLQFAPALIFAATLLVAPLLASRPSLHPRLIAGAAVVGLAGAVLLLLLADGPAWRADPEASRTVSGEELAVRLGSGYLAGGARLVTGFSNGIAVVSTTRRLKADDYPLLRLVTSGDNRKHVTVFWRRAAEPEELHSIKVDGPRGLRWRRLADEPAWRGLLLEFGLLLYDDAGRPLLIDALALHPETPLHWLALTAGNWFERDGWSMKSVHFLSAGKMSLRESLPLLVLVGLCLSLAALGLALRRRSEAGPAAALALALAGWLILDGRWTLERAARAGDTVRHYPLVRAVFLELGDDATLGQLARRAAASASGPLRPLLITTLAPGEDRMELRRMRYHALPRPAFVHDGPPATLPPMLDGDILVLRKRYGAGSAGDTPMSVAERAGERLGAAFDVHWDEGEGFLLARQAWPH